MIEEKKNINERDKSFNQSVKRRMTLMFTNFSD